MTDDGSSEDSRALAERRRKLTAELKARYACELARGDAARRAHIYAEIDEQVEQEIRKAVDAARDTRHV